MFQVGDRIREYDIAARLKSGGMATLFLARRSGAAGFARHVALKVIHPHLAEDQAFVSMFLDEARLSARIHHPNVVHVEELGQTGDSYFLVMEYVHGCALSQLVRQLARDQLRLAPELAVHIAIKLAEGLHAAHEVTDDAGELLGVVHRDVSPQNVLLSYKGHVKLIDFGIAKARGRARQTTSRSLKGKLRYMSPEQAYGRGVDRRTDIYAAGVVLWELLTMRRLFVAEDELDLLEQVRHPNIQRPSMLAGDIPPALDDAVMAALAPDAARRPPTAQAWRRMLAQALPDGAALDPADLSVLLHGAMRDQIAQDKRDLPDSVTSVLKDELDAPDEAASHRTLSMRHEGSDLSSELDIVEGTPESANASPRPRSAGSAPEAPRGRASVRRRLAAAAALAAGVIVTFVALGDREAPPSNEPVAPPAPVVLPSDVAAETPVATPNATADAHVGVPDAGALASAPSSPLDEGDAPAPARSEGRRGKARRARPTQSTATAVSMEASPAEVTMEEVAPGRRQLGDTSLFVIERDDGLGD